MLNKMSRLFLLYIAALAAILLIVSCASKPKPPEGPEKALLDELSAAQARAQSGRVKAMAVQAQVYFPEEWNTAETNNNSGKNTKKDTSENVKQAIAFFNYAADGYEAIAGKAGALYAQELEETNKTLQAAMARAEKSRKDAEDNQAPTYFPDEWAGAEAEYQSGLDAKKETLEEIKAAIALFNSVADKYDDIGGKSKQMLAEEKAAADKDLQAAMARADKSRQAAMSVNGQNYFPNDWKDAEAKNTNAKNAKKTTVDEIKAATELFVSAADAYDDIAGRSQQRFAKDSDDANKALQAAMARADKSRQTAITAGAQTTLPNDWRNADTKHTNAKNAKKSSLDEIKAATALFVSAADAFDDLAKKTQQAIAKERDDANKALQAAISRMERSRKAAQDAKANVNLPDEWNAAETKNKTATGAKRSNPAEMKAAVPLYNAAADAYDDLVKKNTAFISAQNAQIQKAAADAKARAEKERQNALDVRANLAAAEEFDGAEMLFNQAAKAFGDKNLTLAAETYNKAADQYIAAVLLSIDSRPLAEETLAEAKQKSIKSSAFASKTANEIGVNRDELVNNQYMKENLRLIGLAEDAYANFKYADTYTYAREAIKNSELSDEYVALQAKIKGALDAIAAAEARLDQAKKLDTQKKYSDILVKAESTFNEALDYRSREEWDPARESALAVIAILADIPGSPVLPAQYRVKTWNRTRDCLWNIAAKKEIYGDPFKWRILYNANRQKFTRPGNPNLIEPGMILDIPSINGEFRSGILEE